MKLSTKYLLRLLIRFVLKMEQTKIIFSQKHIDEANILLLLQKQNHTSEEKVRLVEFDIFKIDNPFEIAIQGDLARWIEKSKFILNDSTYSGKSKNTLILFQVLFKSKNPESYITINSQIIFSKTKI